MAELLKQWHGLLAIKVTLFASAPGTQESRSGEERPHPHIEFMIERNRNGETVWRQSALLPLSAAGIPDTLEDGPTAPFELADALKSLLAGALADSDPDEPLWLHLVKPYGHLGALPWERQLTEATGRPVLRLPDFLEPPREDKSVLVTAIVCDLALDDPVSRKAFRRVLDAWVAAPGRDEIRIHVFASRLIQHAAKDFASDPRVVFHHSEDLAAESETVQDSWQNWVTSAMAGQALDAVHFLCRATLVHGRSCIALSRPFQRTAVTPLAFVYAPELASGLTQTGAWCMIATGPADGSSDTALRHFVDAMAQTRPGPALYHRFEPDTIESELGPAFVILFNEHRFGVPEFKHSFLYCQPALAMPGLVAVPQAEILPLHQNAELLEAGHLFAAAAPDAPGQVPNWVAATQRFAEAVALDTRRNTSGDVLMSEPLAPTSFAQVSTKSVSIVEDTLGEIQRIVNEYAKETLSGTMESEG